MIDILGDEMIGFWHLIDQIIIFEGIMPTIPKILPNQK